MTAPGQETQLSFAVIILAAGRSVRMGSPKMLLPWGQSTVLGHLIAQWRNLQARQIATVCAANDQLIESELARIQFPARNRIENPRPEDGMFSSIQCAARWGGWEPGLTHWVIALGDQPHLANKTLQALLNCCANHPTRICQPGYSGRGYHPVCLPREVFATIATTTASTLKQFLASAPADHCLSESDNPGLLLDFDYPEDYQRALEKYGPKSTDQ